MKKYYLLIIVLLLGIGTYFMLFQKDDNDKLISVSMNTWPGYEPIVLAKEKGFLGDNVKINRMGSATDVLATFNSGDTDVAFLTLDEVFLLRDRVDYPIKIISILDYSNGADVIISQSNIKNLQDLRGKRVGVESTAIGAYLLLRAFELNKYIDLSEIEVVQMDYSYHEEAFKSFKVEAVATFEPIKTHLINFGGNVLFDSSSIPNEILDVMVVRESTLSEKSKELKEFVESWYKAIDYIDKDYSDSMAIMAKHEGVYVDEFKLAHKGIFVPNLANNRKLLSLEDTSFLDNVKTLESILLKNNMIVKTNNFKKLFSDELLPK